MKLAFCLFKYFPFGGLQRDFFRIAQECVRRGHQVDVFTMDWQGETDASFNITLIPSKGLQNHTRCQHFVAKVQENLVQQNYDLIIGFNKMPGLDLYYAADTCYQSKARQQHGAWYRLTPRYQHLVSYEKAVFAAGNKTKILLIAKNQQAEFKNYYQTEDERFFCLPPGIARDRIAPDNPQRIRAQFRQELGIRPEQKLLLMVGSGFKTKGLDRAIHAFAELPTELKNHTLLWIIGEDNNTPFRRLASSLGISEQQIKYLGGRKDVPQFLLAADLLLHPAYNENTGTVILEALVAGLPVLTTDVCGYAHYVTDAQAGRVLPSPFQQIQFNKMLIDVLSSLPRIDWQQNALTFAKTANIYSMPEQAADIIESIQTNR